MDEQIEAIAREDSEFLRAKSGRSCGSCYTCCVALGIKELRKRSGMACKHLSGVNGPEHRCSIYEQKPKACSDYYCMWMFGAFDDDMRPDQCGLIVTPYPPEEGDGAGITIHVTDADKAGTIAKGPLSKAISWIFERADGRVDRLVIVNDKTRRVIEFNSEGEIWEGHLISVKEVEALLFARIRPLGRYLTAKSVADVPEHILKRGIVLGQGQEP